MVAPVSATSSAAAAAAAFHERDLEAERFKNTHRGDADVRLVIAHKGVVPENDAPALSGERGRGARATHVLREPFVEAAHGVVRQGPLR